LQLQLLVWRSLVTVLRVTVLSTFLSTFRSRLGEIALQGCEPMRRAGSEQVGLEFLD
tara:strand:+ start:821 stop:991 length:171 start_codon:yes stop_codon:yes gene_type:complete